MSDKDKAVISLRQALRYAGGALDRDFERYPRGMWECAGGETVLFDRARRPIMLRRADGSIEPDDPGRQVVHEWEILLYPDHLDPSVDLEVRLKVESIFAAWAALMLRVPEGG